MKIIVIIIILIIIIESFFMQQSVWIHDIQVSQIQIHSSPEK